MVFVIPEVCNALSGTGEVGIPDHVKSGSVLDVEMTILDKQSKGVLIDE